MRNKKNQKQQSFDLAEIFHIKGEMARKEKIRIKAEQEYLFLHDPDKLLFEQPKAFRRLQKRKERQLSTNEKEKTLKPSKAQKRKYNLGRSCKTINVSTGLYTFRRSREENQKDDVRGERSLCSTTAKRNIEYKHRNDFFKLPRRRNFFFNLLSIKSLIDTKESQKAFREEIAYLKSISFVHNQAYIAGPKKAHAKRKKNTAALIRYINCSMYKCMKEAKTLVWRGDYNTLHNLYKEGKIQFPARTMIATKEDLEDLGFLTMTSEHWFDENPNNENFCRTYAPSDLTLKKFSKIKTSNRDQVKRLYELNKTANIHPDEIRYKDDKGHIIKYHRPATDHYDQEYLDLFKDLDDLFTTAMYQEGLLNVLVITNELWESLPQTKKNTMNQLINSGQLVTVDYLDEHNHSIELDPKYMNLIIYPDLSGEYKHMRTLYPDQLPSRTYDHLVKNKDIYFPILSCLNNKGQWIIDECKKLDDAVNVVVFNNNNNKCSSKDERREEERYTNNNQTGEDEQLSRTNNNNNKVDIKDNNTHVKEDKREIKRYTNNNQCETLLKYKDTLTLETPRDTFDDLDKNEKKRVKKIVYVINDLDHKRIFNQANEDDDNPEAGRWYGYTAQQLPKEVRPFIFGVDREGKYHQTVEVDYTSLHPTMLYHKKHLTPPEKSYIFDDGEKRTEAKLALNIMINAKSGKESAISAIRHSFVKKLRYKKDDDRLSKRYIENLMDMLEEKHQGIKSFFYTGEGLRLQTHDSWIATNVMINLAKKGVRVVPIHDSFIVDYRKKDLLIDSMNREYRNELGVRVSPGLKVVEGAILADSNRQGGHQRVRLGAR